MTLVAERSRRVDALWGFLALAFAAALIRGAAGGAGVALDVLFALLLAGTVAAWIWFRRHPASLEITPEAIVFRHRGQAGTTLPPGTLTVRETLLGASDRLLFLKVSGSEEAIPLQLFDLEQVKAAARAAGWRFEP